MSVETPNDINVLSRDFKRLFYEVCVEVNRLSNLYADLNRLRAIVDRSGSAQGSPARVFEITGGGTEIQMDGFRAKEYTGVVFDLIFGDPPDDGGGDGGAAFRMGSQILKRSAEQDAVGYDVYNKKNEPQEHPAKELIEDPLETGTMVLCTAVLNKENNYVFSSVLPRFSVVCPDQPAG